MSNTKKTDIQNSKKYEPTLGLQYSLIALLTLIWTPLSFMNFDSSHDGLILATIRLTKASLLNHAEYPLNQYGPFWVMPFVLLSFLLPKTLVFLGVRLLTVFFYLLSAFLLFQIARFFLNPRLANLVVILFLGSQPFVSDFKSDLVPWPSAVVMPIAMAIAYYAIKQIQESNLGRSSSYDPIYIGLLLPMVILTRIQVGLVILIAAIISIYISEVKYRFVMFLAGFLGSSLMALLFLYHFKWLRDAFYDQIILGSKYMSADIGFFPKPVFTLLGVLFFCVIWVAGPKIVEKMLRINSKSLVITGAFAITSILFLGIYLSASRSISSLASLVTVSRRFWITSCLAMLLVASLRLVIFTKERRRARSTSGRLSMNFFILLLFALGLQSQIFPLFDQMHFWWGSPLTFLVVVIVCNEQFAESFFTFRYKMSLVIICTSLLLLSVLLPWTAQISSHKESLPIEIGTGIYSSPENARIQKELQVFFHKNIDAGNKVLNLCEKGNVFFEDSQYLSASRIFVFWGELMSQAPSIYHSILKSKPNVIITCSGTSTSSLDIVQIKRQQSILKVMMPTPTEPAEYYGEPRTVWRIYRIFSNS